MKWVKIKCLYDLFIKKFRENAEGYYRRIRAFTSLIFILPLVVSINSCQKSRNDLNKNNTETSLYLTGATKNIEDPFSDLPIVVPYTGIGEPTAVDQLKSQISEDQYNVELGQRIKNLTLDKSSTSEKLWEISLVIENEKSKETQNVKFKVDPDSLKNANGNFVKAKAVDIKNPSLNYELDVSCVDTDCNKISTILTENLLSENAKSEDQRKVQPDQTKNTTPVRETVESSAISNKQTLAPEKKQTTDQSNKRKIGILVTTQEKVAVIERTQPSGELQTEQKRVIQESIEVTNGPSYVHIRSIDPASDQGDTSQSQENVVKIDSDLTLASDVSTPVREAKIGNKNVKAELIGNSTTGDIAINVDKQESSEALTIYVTTNEELNEQLERQKEYRVKSQNVIWATLPGAIIPVDFSDSKLRKTQELTVQMEELRFNPIIQKYMSYWKGDEAYPSCNGGGTQNLNHLADQFFHNLSALVPHTKEIFRTLDVTPEIMYISALESKYAVSEGWEIESSHCRRGENCTTAAGPYQITRLAADYLTNTRPDGLNFITFPFLNGRQVHPKDDRRYFIPTTFAAATYAKDLMSWFPNNPEFWPLGYTEGQGALAVAMKCSLESSKEKANACKRETSAGRAFSRRNEIKGATIDRLVKYRMAPACKIDYLLKYLSLKFVGANPSEFGIQIDPSRVPKTLPPMFRPGQNNQNLAETMFR